MSSPLEVNTKDPTAICAYAQNTFISLGWGQSATWVDKIFRDVTSMFAGKYPGYLGIDMSYHDFEHTLQATVCLLDIIRGRQRNGATPPFQRRDAELSLMAVLLHDAGFLKQVNDTIGTGAKYTLVHERRSCQFARTYLPQYAVTPDEMDDVCAAINCTGPRNHIAGHTFHRPEARIIACIVVTADYLAQMSAPDYLGKLPLLYREFQEAFDYEMVPADKRPYHSLRDLQEKTSDFWHKFVLPLLDNEADAVYRHLSITGQPNPYLLAVEDNLTKIRHRLQEDKV
jgi:hypothetical protein